MGFLTGQFDGGPGDGLTAQITRKYPQHWPKSFPVGPQHLKQARREHDVASLVAFTLIDAQRHALAADAGHLEMDGFGETRKPAA